MKHKISGNGIINLYKQCICNFISQRFIFKTYQIYIKLNYVSRFNQYVIQKYKIKSYYVDIEKIKKGLVLCAFGIYRKNYLHR